MQIDEIYPGHAEALRKAGRDPTIYPTFGEIWKKNDEWLAEDQFIKEAEILKLLKQLKQCFKLKWLHIVMILNVAPVTAMHVLRPMAYVCLGTNTEQKTLSIR
eukprot:15027404-Ditylum_brightwellii.AAC.1